MEKENKFLTDRNDLPFIAYLFDGYATLHWHTYIEILYMIEGQMIVNIKNKEFQAQKGDFFIINSQDIHYSKKYLDKSCLYLIIQFEPSIMNANYNSIFEIKYLLPFLKNEVDYKNCFALEENSELKVILNKVLEEFERKDIAYELEIKGDIYKIFSLLIRKNFLFAPLADLSFDNLVSIKKLLTYIEANYFEDINMKQAANMACMSYSYFSKKFKRIMGKNFTAYINFVRLREAEKLLLTTDKNISSVACEVGFYSSNYFIRLFKKEHCMAPMRYRKLNRATFERKIDIQ